MEKISRRKMLLTGGALGAVGALGMATPAGAKTLWTWKPAGSVAASGTGADPHWVWDDETDPLVASLLDRGDVPRVNQLLRGWTTNAQALPAGLPADVRAYIEEARKLPSWADQAKLDKATAFYKKRGLYLGLTYGFGSGMMSTAIPNEARAVYYSKGGADMRDRITKTAKLGHDIGDLNAYKPDGDMIVTAVKTRMTHAAVRHLLPQSPQWPVVNGQKPIPISQADIMVTWHSLATFANKTLVKWKLNIPQAEFDAYLHLWQVTAHMLGVKDEYIPNSWAEAGAQSAQVLDPILQATPEGVELADILLELASFDLNGDGRSLLRPPLHALTRYMLGDRVTDALQIPREPFWDGAVKTFWPLFVAIREGAILFVPPDIFWAFDEILRTGVLFYLGEAQNIFIEMPTANRTTFPS
jgi:endo-cleaving rubber dioxygenase